MVSQFRIVRVDLDGFNGRENHPAAEHVGLIVRAFAMRSFYADDDALSTVDDVTEDDARHEDPARLDDAISLWSCVTDDGQLLDLLDFEIEPVTAAAAEGQRHADALRACTGAVRVTVNDGDRSAVSPPVDVEGAK